MSKAEALNIRAKFHESQGNTLLASWMVESAIHAAKVQNDIDSFLDRLEESRISSYSHQETRKSSFRTEWYSYEDEYQFNWEGGDFNA